MSGTSLDALTSSKAHAFVSFGEHKMIESKAMGTGEKQTSGSLGWLQVHLNMLASVPEWTLPTGGIQAFFSAPVQGHSAWDQAAAQPTIPAGPAFLSPSCSGLLLCTPSVPSSLVAVFPPFAPAAGILLKVLTQGFGLLGQTPALSWVLTLAAHFRLHQLLFSSFPPNSLFSQHHTLSTTPSFKSKYSLFYKTVPNHLCQQHIYIYIWQS